jgi:hypothetical protein
MVGKEMDGWMDGWMECGQGDGRGEWLRQKRLLQDAQTNKTIRSGSLAISGSGPEPCPSAKSPGLLQKSSGLFGTHKVVPFDLVLKKTRKPRSSSSGSLGGRTVPF